MRQSIPESHDQQQTMFASLSHRARELQPTCLEDFMSRSRRSSPEHATLDTEEDTTDQHIFFSFPREIRHQIYRLLLAPKDQKGWIHTSLLECSKRFNRDATPILYSENTFQLEWFYGEQSLTDTWVPKSKQFGFISRMSIGLKSIGRHTDAETINQLLPLFMGLKEVELALGYDAKKGAALLAAVKENLEKIDRVVLEFPIIKDGSARLFNFATADAATIQRREYARGYGDVFEVPEGYLGMPKKLDFELLPANWLGKMGTLRLTLEKEEARRNERVDALIKSM